MLLSKTTVFNVGTTEPYLHGDGRGVRLKLKQHASGPFERGGGRAVAAPGAAADGLTDHGKMVEVVPSACASNGGGGDVRTTGGPGTHVNTQEKGGALLKRAAGSLVGRDGTRLASVDESMRDIENSGASLPSRFEVAVPRWPPPANVGPPL